MKPKFSDHIIEIVRLMLKFDEPERPSFIELAKLVLTSTENSIETPKDGIAQSRSKLAQPDAVKKMAGVMSSQ